MKGFETVRSSVMGAAAAVLIAGGISMALAQQVPVPAQVAPFIPFGDRQPDNRVENVADEEQQDEGAVRYILVVRTPEAGADGESAVDASYPGSGQQPATPAPATPDPDPVEPEAVEEEDEPDDTPVTPIPAGPDSITDGSNDPGPDPVDDEKPGDLAIPGVKPESEGGSIGDLATPTDNPKLTVNTELIKQLDPCKLSDCEPEPKPVLTIEPEIVQQPAPALQALQPTRSLTR